MLSLLIGIDNYRNLPPSMQLKYCVSDAKAVGQVLMKEFQVARVETLYNESATREGIMAKFSKMNRFLGANDGLFVFVASHGTTVRDVGFIVPHDDALDEAETFRNISMAQLKDEMGKLLKAKHVFFVIDACYSGSILEKRGDARRPDWNLEHVREVSKEPVRFALTAGDKGQQVLDGGPGGRSVFAGRFVEALQESQAFLTATEVSEKISRKVYSDARDRGHVQTPQCGSLLGQGQMEKARSQEEKTRLELILQKRQAQEQAIRLEQETLAVAEARRLEQLKREREIQVELARNQERAAEELAKVRQANEEKRRLLEELRKLGGSFSATVKPIEQTETTIREISSSVDASQARTLIRLKTY